MKRIMNSALAIVLLLSSSMVLSAQDEATPETAASLYNAGVAKYKEKDYAGALELFEKALEIADETKENEAKVITLAKKNGSSAIYQVASTKRKAKEYDEAIALFDKGIEWAPEKYNLYYGKAQCIEAKGEKMEAISGYILAADMAEKAGKADRAGSYVKKAERVVAKTAAAKQWDNVMAMSELFGERESAGLHYYIAGALMNKGENLEALSHAQRSVAMAEEGSKDKYLFLLAKAYEANNEKDKAIATYKEVPEGRYFENAQYKVKELTGSR